MTDNNLLRMLRKVSIEMYAIMALPILFGLAVLSTIFENYYPELNTMRWIVGLTLLGTPVFGIWLNSWLSIDTLKDSTSKTPINTLEKA